MKVITTPIEGVLLIEPSVFYDKRGYFMESFSEREFNRVTGLNVNFVQDNESMSDYGVMRGLHFQKPPYSQAKLVRCVVGSVLDVAVDLRKGSKTFGKYFVAELTAENHLQLFIPKGFAHGFSVLSENALFQYKCDEYYHPESEGGICLTDSNIGIDWRIPADKAILSAKDMKYPSIKDFDSPF